MLNRLPQRELEALMDEYLDEVDDKDQNGDTVLHLACRYQYSGQYIMSLLAMDTNHAINQPDRQGDLPLHVALLHHNVCCSEFIIGVMMQVCQSSMQQCNHHGDIPLHIACYATAPTRERVIMK
jgi:ankyrin repeat protein